jgi:Leucine-rich repeat (LRR) protein
MKRYRVSSNLTEEQKAEIKQFLGQVRRNAQSANGKQVLMRRYGGTSNQNNRRQYKIDTVVGGAAIVPTGVRTNVESGPDNTIVLLESLAEWLNNIFNAHRPYTYYLGLKELNLDEYGLANVHELIGLLHVQTLKLSMNQLTHLPDSFGQLRSLRKLDLSMNALTHLPASFGHLESLQTLDLSSNNLTRLPASFGQLTNLQTLDVSRNQLTRLPASFGQLTNLQTLDVSRNQLTSLPESFGQLQNLRTLDLTNNQLTRLPESFERLENLERFDVDEAVREYYRQLNQH